MMDTMSNPQKKPETVIALEDLTTVLDGQTILKELTLQVQRGEILAIVGGSGSGKTTLLRTILMLQPAKGSIKIFGTELLNGNETEHEKIRHRWGVMFQHSALFSSLTVLENIAFPLNEYTELAPRVIANIAKIKLGMVGLSLEAAHKYPAELSGGMQRRVALARAIATDPELLLLDEPTTGLDPQASSGLDQLIINLRKSLGLTVLMVTHDLETIWRTTDRVAFLGEGKVLETGVIGDLYRS